MSPHTKRKYLWRTAIVILILSCSTWLFSLFGGGVVGVNIDNFGIKWQPRLAILNGQITYTDLQDDYHDMWHWMIIDGMLRLEMKQPRSQPTGVDYFEWRLAVTNWNTQRNRIASQLTHQAVCGRLTIDHNITRSWFGFKLKSSLDLHEALGRFAKHRFFAKYGHTIILASGWPCLLVALLSILIIIKLRGYPRGHCQACGYNLTNNTTGTCPECGTAFPPAPVKSDAAPQNP